MTIAETQSDRADKLRGLDGLVVSSLIEAARRRADRFPEAEVFVGPGTSISVATLLGDAEALASGLWHLGLRPGQVVSFQLPNWPEAAVINLAAAALGLIVSPLVPIYRDAELQFMLNDSATRAVFIPESFGKHDFAGMYRRLERELLHEPLIVEVRGRAGSGLALNALIEKGRAEPVALPAAPEIDGEKLLLYTSGTTGRPKAVRHSQRTLNHAMARSVAEWGLTPGQRILMPSPVTHATGYVNALELPFLFGTQCVLMDRWDATEAVGLIDRYGVSATVGATPFLRELVDAAQAVGTTLPSLRIFACGGAAVPPDLIRRANNVFAQAPAFRAYGSSEAPYITLGFPGSEDPERAALTDGRISGYQVRVLDDSGTDVALGESGEIAVRGPSLFIGYAREDDMQASFTADGFFLTGDIGARDADDTLTITDRKKDIIIRGGENISAREIEEAMLGHPSFAEVAVVSMPHERLGEGVCAFVVAEPGTSLAPGDIQAFLERSGLARQKNPERIFIIDQLPRTPSGKVRKDVLRSEARTRVACGAAVDRTREDKPVEDSKDLVFLEKLDDGVGRIVLNRPEKGNAQNVAMTYALDAAFMAAARDNTIKVIILSGKGKHFSTGHDLKDTGFEEVGVDYQLTSTWSNIETGSIEGWYGLEREIFLDMCRRWRAIAKPTIAQVQGACMGGGLMLAWICDLIIAADNAVFQDPVVNFGVGGVEYIVHAWELGARQAKEMLFTADRWTAEDAHRWGMVNRVVPLDRIEAATLELARQIAAKPMFALKLVKEAINGSLDAQGQQLAVDRGFALHQLAHAHNRLRYGGLLDPSGVPEAIRKGGDIPPLVFGPSNAR